MSHKVVYNACYGGFELSMSAIAWLEAHCEDIELKQFIKDNLDKGSLHVTYAVSGWFNDKRHHKDLVAVVETLGNKASGSCAELEIMEISCNQYRIEEYDGSEEVVTHEDSDWIIIND